MEERESVAHTLSIAVGLPFSLLPLAFFSAGVAASPAPSRFES